MKRSSPLIAIVLSLLLLASCGGGSSEPAEAGELTTLETTLWTLDYDDSQWVLDEEYLYEDETTSQAILGIPGEDDTDLISIEIRADITDPYGFRSNLVYYGFDEYDYAMENAYDLHDVGGVDCLMEEGSSWGDPCQHYFGRVEAANASVYLEICGDYTDERVTALLKGLSFDLPDIGNEDGPWYWEGEPFQGRNSSVQLGGFTLESTWVPFLNPVMTYETFDHQIAATGDRAYILSESILQEYELTGESLAFLGDLETGLDISYISTTADGSLWLSDFTEPLTVWKDGAQTASYEGTDNVVMHPSGQWGVSWFSNPECQKVAFSGDSMTTTPLTFQGMSSVSSLSVGQNYIMAAGIAEEDDCHKVFLYDPSGTPVMTLTGPDDLGSVTYVAETPNGFLAVDANMREILLWSTDGTYIGTADDGELFGTYYPWISHGTQLPDGSILILMTEERDDRSAMEVLVYRLSGF